MKSCAVLGNGPGLKPENVPDGVFLIGVNRSFRVVWSPIVCSADGIAAQQAHSQSKALSIFVTRGCIPVGTHSVAYFDPPKWGGNSGAFGIWIATQMRFERIYLVGFGGDGHFDGTDEFKREYYRPNIEAAIEFAKSRGAEVVHTVEVMA